MFTIWKYPLKIMDAQKISMPRNARVLCVAMQRGEPCLWCLVDSNTWEEERKFLIFGTGHEIKCEENQLHYIGTFQHGVNHIFVGHVFEYKEINP